MIVVIDSTTGNVVRRHAIARYLRQWAASMNIGEGWCRFVVATDPDRQETT